MPTLPWTASKRTRPPTGDVIVMASRFQLRERRHVLPFLLSAMRIRRQMLESTGAVGVSLIAHPIAKTFYTLSAWDDRAALDAAVLQQPHLDTMTQFRSRTEESSFAFWSTSAALRPRWDEARRRLEMEARRASKGRGEN